MNQNELIIYRIDPANYVQNVGTAKDLAIDVVIGEHKRWLKVECEFEVEAIDAIMDEMKQGDKWRFNALPYFRFKGNEAELQRALKCPGTLKRFLEEYSEVYEELQEQAEKAEKIAEEIAEAETY